MLITLNMAMTADGKVAARGGGGSGFGSAADRRRLVELRAPADALVVGQATLKADRMSMNLASRPDLVAAREVEGRPGHPARVVVANEPDWEMLEALAAKPGGPIWVVTPQETVPAAIPGGVRVMSCAGEGADDHVVEAMQRLAEAEGWRHVHCEGGPRLARRFFSAGVVRMLSLTVTPLLFGGHSGHTVCGAGWMGSFATSSRWRAVSATAGSDGECFLTYEPV